MRVGIALFALGLSACVVGEIEGAGTAPSRRRDAGAVSGNVDGGSGDDLPPVDEEPAPPPPPSSEPKDAGGAPPPPAADSGGGAPPPPAADSGGGAPPPPPATDYPTGPYGLSVGYVVPNVSLSGYRDATGAWTAISLGEYYDPTGARGVRALLITSSAAWCGPCREEAKDLVDMYSATYKARGAKFLTAMIQDSSSNPAKQSTVDAWITYAGTNFDIVADPSQKLIKSGASLPFNFVVDPRTMKVVKSWSGAEPGATSIPAVDTVLTKNGG